MRYQEPNQIQYIVIFMEKLPVMKRVLSLKIKRSPKALNQLILWHIKTAKR